MRRFISVFMALAIIFTSAVAEFPITAVTAQAVSNVGDAEFASKIKDLQNKFKDGEYWNAYNPCGYEGTGKIVCPTASCQAQGFCGNPNNKFICPCKCGAFVLNGVELSWNCLGFACKIGNLIFGGNPYAWSKHKNVDNLRPGDMIYGSGLIGSYVHAIYILEVNGNSVKFADCNATGPDRVRWGATISRSAIGNALKNNGTYVYHASNNNVSGGTHIHSYQFKYFLAEHPHRDYYECSCGEGYTDSSSSRFYAGKGCSQCCATITPGAYYFLNKGTGLALNLDHNTNANLQNIHMYDYSPGYTTQQMVISVRSAADKSYKIRPTISKRLVQTYGNEGVTTSGMNVNIYDDVNDNTQWWHFQAVSGGYVIRNAANTTCALTASNGNAIVSTYTGSANQIWTLQAVSAASAQKYTIAYNANGGSGTMANTEMTVGTAAYLRANAFTRTGYTFLGWSTSASATTATYTDKQSVNNLATDGTVTLYAVWKANSYTISYNANGGSGNMANTAMTYGTSQALRANAFTRTGYTFLGWSTSSTATTATYADKALVADLAGGATSVALYAVWKANPVSTYTIKYDGNGNTSGYMNDTKATYNTSVNLQKNTYKNFGSRFKGWSTNKNATAAQYTDGQSVKNLAQNGTVTLYAVWEHIEAPRLTGIKVTMVTADSITLSWDVIDVDGYDIWKDDVYFDKVHSNSITFTELKPSTTYSFDVLPYIEGASCSIGSRKTVTTLSELETVTGAVGAGSVNNSSNDVPAYTPSTPDTSKNSSSELIGSILSFLKKLFGK